MGPFSPPPLTTVLEGLSDGHIGIPEFRTSP